VTDRRLLVRTCESQLLFFPGFLTWADSYSDTTLPGLLFVPHVCRPHPTPWPSRCCSPRRRASQPTIDLWPTRSRSSALRPREPRAGRGQCAVTANAGPSENAGRNSPRRRSPIPKATRLQRQHGGNFERPMRISRSSVKGMSAGGALNGPIRCVRHLRSRAEFLCGARRANLTCS